MDWELLEQKVAEVVGWSRNNGLLLDAAKSCYLAFSLSGSLEKRPIAIHEGDCQSLRDRGGGQICNVSAVRYLSITIDEKLNWKLHVAGLLSKLRTAAATITKLSYAVGRKTTTVADILNSIRGMI